METQNLVYPAWDGRGMVISRRFLAQRAGQEDYQVLDALEAAMAAATEKPAAVEASRKYIEKLYDRALSLSPRERGYQTHITPGTLADLLDQIREDIVTRIAMLLPPPGELAMTLDAKNILSVHTPDAGTLRVRYVVDGKLPWHAEQRPVVAGDTKLALETTGRDQSLPGRFHGSIGAGLGGHALDHSTGPCGQHFALLFAPAIERRIAAWRR